ncbi:hypothetical protein AM228_08140 [Planktothricoides sp. SR001]|nr:hypothetical protein AM228_08140 [Planktothricoides sp. SR001]
MALGALRLYQDTRRGEAFADLSPLQTLHLSTRMLRLCSQRILGYRSPGRDLGIFADKVNRYFFAS